MEPCNQPLAVAVDHAYAVDDHAERPALLLNGTGGDQQHTRIGCSGALLHDRGVALQRSWHATIRLHKGVRDEVVGERLGVACEVAAEEVGDQRADARRAVRRQRVIVRA